MHPYETSDHKPIDKKNKSFTGYRTVLDELLDKPCQIQTMPSTEPTHSLRACWVLRLVAKSGEAILTNTTPEKHSSEDDDLNGFTVFETFSSNNQCKRALRDLVEVNQVTAINPWSDTAITFATADEPRARSVRAPAALVLNPIMDGFRLTKVLMDGGIGLNLIYEDTLDKMQMDKSRIEQSSTTFRGIIPSREARCSGKIKLDVVFGTPNNYRSEELLFHVAPFNSGYHTLLGRDAFTRFKAIPHYGYMKLKMPGPNGVINITSDPNIALCAENKITSLAL